jgi:hypothetical protein
MRAILTGLAVAALLLGAPPARAQALPVAADLARDAREAAARRVPILVFFHATDCAYCAQVEQLYLRPMHTRGDRGGKVLIRAVQVDGRAPLRDFAGRAVDHAGFARRERAGFTPLVRLYGPDGRELVPALVGYSSPDYYLGMLEDAIDRAHARLARR